MIYLSFFHFLPWNVNLNSRKNSSYKKNYKKTNSLDVYLPMIFLSSKFNKDFLLVKCSSKEKLWSSEVLFNWKLEKKDYVIHVSLFISNSLIYFYNLINWDKSQYVKKCKFRVLKKKKKKKKKHLKKTNNFFSRILISRFDSNKIFLRNLVSPWNWKSFLVAFYFHGFQTSTGKQRKFRTANISYHKVDNQSIGFEKRF